MSTKYRIISTEFLISTLFLLVFLVLTRRRFIIANSLEKNATILRLSKKHMVGRIRRILGKFEPVPSLKYRQAE